MGLLDDVTRSTIGGGSSPSQGRSPIMMALLALLASRVMSGQGSRPQAPQAGDMGGLRDLVDRFRQGGLQDVIGLMDQAPGRTSRSHPTSCMTYLAARPSTSSRGKPACRVMTFSLSCHDCCPASSTSLPPMGSCQQSRISSLGHGRRLLCRMAASWATARRLNGLGSLRCRTGGHNRMCRRRDDCPRRQLCRGWICCGPLVTATPRTWAATSPSPVSLPLRPPVSVPRDGEPAREVSTPSSPAVAVKILNPGTADVGRDRKS